MDSSDHDTIKCIKKDIHDLQMAVLKIETNMKHTIENKHAETLSVAKAIDVKFKWISVTIGMVATIGVIASLVEAFR